MMNYVWTAMIVLSLFAAIAKGNITSLSDTLVTGGTSAVELTLKLLGVIAFWSGIMNIAERSGLTRLICAALSPVMRLIFPKISKHSPEMSAMTMNITANLLGLGSAATPLGLEAMSRLKEKSVLGDTATNEMVRFVVMNSAAIHLVPTTVAMLRSEHGSASPMDIMLPALLTSVIALTGGLLMTGLLQKLTAENNQTKRGGENAHSNRFYSPRSRGINSRLRSGKGRKGI